VKKWNLVIDVASCTNCHLCTLSAADEYVGNEFPGYTAPMPKHGHRWVDILQKERGQRPMIDLAYVPTMCNHCDDPPCLAASRNGAVTKRADGIVLIDPVRARGQKQIVDACPYGHVWWNEELQLPQSWPFDAHLLDNGWVHTRGDQACPTGAMRSVKLEDADMARTAAWSIAWRVRGWSCSMMGTRWRRCSPTIMGTSNSIGWRKAPAPIAWRSAHRASAVVPST